MPKGSVAATPMTGAHYVFAVAELSRPHLKSALGFGGESIRVVGLGRQKALVQTCHPGFLAGADAGALAAAVLHHHKVLQSMMKFTRSLVPCRFGTLVNGDETAVSGWLKATVSNLQPMLARVRDCWELAVAVERQTAGTGASEPPPLRHGSPLVATASARTAPGKAFLQDRMEREYMEQFREKQNVRLRAELLEAIAPLVKEWLPELVQSASMVARFTFLVPQRNLADFAARLEMAADALHLTITQQEVLPPYSFAAWGAAESDTHPGR